MPHGKSRGYTLVALLATLAVISVGLSVVGPLWSARQKQEREEDLLRIGLLYARAIAAYQTDAPGTSKDFPTSLNQLVLDKRFAGVTRYLRAIYPDPTAPLQPWGLLRNSSGQLIGVYSQSSGKPIRQSGVSIPDARFGNLLLQPAEHYSDWKFTFFPS